MPTLGLTDVYQGVAPDDVDLSDPKPKQRLLWLVTGSEKANMLHGLRDGDRSDSGGACYARIRPGAGRPGGGEAFGAELNLAF